MKKETKESVASVPSPWPWSAEYSPTSATPRRRWREIGRSGSKAAYTPALWNTRHCDTRCRTDKHAAQFARTRGPRPSEGGSYYTTRNTEHDVPRLTEDGLIWMSLLALGIGG